jgi:small subunit ribosomal protein S6
MRAYETTFILAPALDAEGIQREIGAIKAVITSNDGEITAEKEWGRRRLAYPIQDQSEGIYHILRFSLAPDQLPKLDRHFKLNESVLRALVIKDEGLPLDHIGQPSESEDREHRREGRYDRGPRSSDGPPRTPRPEPAAVAAAPAVEPAEAEPSPAVASGGEETSE